ncbi:hypothetical protein HNP29_005028 [Pseudomonas alcaligenes]|nr:hypothetical protein [Pseudomonas alcaligenes]
MEIIGAGKPAAYDANLMAPLQVAAQSRRQERDRAHGFRPDAFIIARAFAAKHG